jgi:hypothetical protein
MQYIFKKTFRNPYEIYNYGRAEFGSILLIQIAWFELIPITAKAGMLSSILAFAKY